MIDTNKIEKIRTQESIPTPEDGFDGEIVTGIVSEAGKRLIAVKYPDGWYYSELSNKLNFKNEEFNLSLKREVKKALLLAESKSGKSVSSGSGGGTNIITSGTTTPSITNVTHKTPSIGDIYVQYPFNYPSNGITQGTTSSTSPKIYIRVSDEVVLKMYYNGIEYKAQEHVDNGYVAPTPAATSIVFCDSEGTTFSSSYHLVGKNVSAYAKCTYNSDVSGALDSAPQADFNTGSNKDFDTANNTRTSSPNNEFQNKPRDGYLSVNWVANGATEGGIAVGSNITSSAKLYARNNKLWGKTSVDFSTASKADIENVLNNVASSQQQGFGTSYRNFGDKEITNASLERVFFAIPNGVSGISSILNSDSNYNTPLLTAFDTINQVGGANINYTNAEGYSENYKIWYSAPQGASTITWRVS